MSFQIRSNLGYLAGLAVAAGLILVLGMVFRPKKTPVPTISETERAQLQNLAQRESLQRRSVLLTRYARDLSDTAARVLQRPDTVSYRAPRPGEMLIVVGVVDAGEPHWITVEFAGYSSVKCGGETLTEINADAVIPPPLARGAVFALNEDAIGAVARCEDRLIITDPKGYAVALRAASDRRFMTCCGVRFSGGIVKEMLDGSVLSRAGVEAGDLILSINGQEVTSDSLLAHVIAAPQVTIDVERAGRKLTLRYETKTVASGALLERASGGTRVASVQSGSLAARLGLRVGDIVIRAGDVRRPAPAVVEKLLATAAAAIVVTREDRQILLESAQ